MDPDSGAKALLRNGTIFDPSSPYNKWQSRASLGSLQVNKRGVVSRDPTWILLIGLVQIGTRWVPRDSKGMQHIGMVNEWIVNNVDYIAPSCSPNSSPCNQ